MEIAGNLIIAILGGLVIALIHTAVEGSPWALRPIIGKAVAYALLIWIALVGPVKVG